MSTVEDKYNLMKKYFNLEEYYEKGYKGQGVTIASVESSNSSHGAMVKNTVLTYAPECKFISYNDCHEKSATGDIDGYLGFPDFVEWCIENKVDIVTSSLDWSSDKEEEIKAIQKLYDNGIIFCNCAGNNGKEIKRDEINKTWDFDKEVITVSGIGLDMKSKITWSGFNYGEAVDIVVEGTNVAYKSFLDPSDEDYEDMVEKYGHNYVWAGWGGTSSATPLAASMFAVYKSFDKSLNSNNVFEKLIDVQTNTFSYKNYDHTILILPHLHEVDIIPEEVKETNIEASDWSKESVIRMMSLGITDGLRLKDNITREETIVMMDRLYKLVGGKNE